MSTTYESPVISIDNGLAEGVYAASGAGSLTFDNKFVWEPGRRISWRLNWSGIEGTITLTTTFSVSIDEIAMTYGDGTTETFQGGGSNTVTVSFPSSKGCPCWLGVLSYNGSESNADSFELTGYSYSVQ